MRGPLILSLALLALPACHRKEAEKPRIQNAWVRLAAVPGRPAAGYFTIRGGAKEDRLVRIDSAVVKKIELHESMAMGGSGAGSMPGMGGGMMTMAPISSLPVPEGAKIEFAPGGKHAMLFDVDARITPGTGIPLLFTFASGYAIEAEAKTVPAGANASGE
jgi:copper(I)-binding protein